MFERLTLEAKNAREGKQTKEAEKAGVEKIAEKKAKQNKFEKAESMMKRNQDIVSVASILHDENENIDVHKLFNEWCKKEGVIMPKCEYPAHF